MAANDQILLKQALAQRGAAIAPELTEQQYFEIFSAEQVLKDANPSYEQITAGIVGGGNDGGVDSIYIIVNGTLIEEDTDISMYQTNVVITLHVTQSTTSQSFQEAAIIKLKDFCDDALDLSKGIDQLARSYNADLVDIVRRFRETQQTLATRFPDLNFSFHYTCMGDTQPSPGVSSKVERLKSTVKRRFSTASCEFSFYGAGELIQLARQLPSTRHTVSFMETPIQCGEVPNYLGLVTLRDYFEFITEGKGQLQQKLLQANVRDYQGSTEVNAAIARELKERPTSDDFWWLNNGITIVADQANLVGKKLTLEDPEVVNGLQTTQEIYKHFTDNRTDKENRLLAVKVIIQGEEASRDRIIRATNQQNSVQAASLRATDKIHRDIEEYLKARDLFYDRRKNHYKNLGKPMSKIISIGGMAQAVMAVILRRPNDARARPSSLLKREEDYKQVFSEGYPLESYMVCARLARRVDEFVKSDVANLDREARRNLKYFLAMEVSFSLTGKTDATAEELGRLDISVVSDGVLEKTLKRVKKAYKVLGGSDQVAKGTELVEKLKTEFVRPSAAVK